MHFDNKWLPLIKGKEQTLPREYLFVAIYNHSRELYAGIFPDKTQFSAKLFLHQIADECPPIPSNIPTRITTKDSTSQHAFVKACADLGIGQKFTRVKRPQTNGKAERIIRTPIEMWHKQEIFKVRKNRQVIRLRFLSTTTIQSSPTKALKI